MLAGTAARLDPLPIARDRTDATPRAGAGIAASPPPLHIDPVTNRALLDIVLLPGFELHDLSCLSDAAALCNEIVGRTVIRRRLLGLTGAPVLSSSGLAVTPELTMTAAGSLHNVAVLAGPPIAAPDRLRLRQALWRFSHGGTRYIAIGHGCLPLLECRRVPEPCIAVAWELRDALCEVYPDAEWVDRPFHVDRQMLSCGGRDGTILLILYCIGRICGDTVAVAIADRLNFDHYGTRFSALPAFATPNLRSAPPLLREVVGIMCAHVEEPLTTKELADRVGYSCREIQRQFVRHFGVPPGKFYKNHRLDRARRLLRQTCMSVTEVALAAGFKTLSHFSELYVRRFGNRPREERRLSQIQ